ncbi:deoxyhypusine synthase [Candidatus Woesearchaeota archaeon]|nr:deoxyhypusine synthase [Candidatus Woesearchaeota archaeon]
MAPDAPPVEGIRIEPGMKAADLAERYGAVGFQASRVGEAVRLIRRMKQDKALVILTFTSNMVSSGLRELFAQLAKERFVDLIITGIGSVEEDLMKTRAPFALGDFAADDIELHRRGINRIGDILVPSEHYQFLEDALQPFFAACLAEKGVWAPSELIARLGAQVDDEGSIIRWASQNRIPIYCPAPTDGAFGLQAYFFKKKHPEFIIDVTADMQALAGAVLQAEKVGGIILGGGFAKHHAIGVSILRDGMDYAVYVSTGTPYDGSLSGARPSEAKSWSKIREQGSTVVVEADATIAFPLIVAGVKG